MIGHSAFSEYAISDFEFIAYVPPPPLELTGTDGYEEKQRKLQKRLEAATRARDRARKKAKEDLRQLIGEQVYPEKYKKADPEESIEEDTELADEKEVRKTLTTKPLADLEAKVLDLQAQLHQLRYAAWQQQEYSRLIALEQQRRRIRDDEEALLLLL